MKALLLGGIVVVLAVTAVGMALGGVGGAAMALLGGGLALGFIGSNFTREAGGAASAERVERERAFLLRLVLAGFAIRLLLSIALHMSGWWEQVGADEETFHNNGHAFAQWVSGDSPYMLSGRYMKSSEKGYFFVVGSLYYAFGVSKVLPLLLNCVLGACLVYPVHALAGRFAGRDAARRAAALVAFFPSLNLWSALLVRDVLVLFLLATALLAADRLRRTFGVRNLIALAVSLALLSMLRTYLFLLVTASIGVALLLGRRSVVQSLVIGGAVVAGLVLTVRYTGLGQSELERANLAHFSQLRKYNAYGMYGEEAMGTLGSDTDISTPTAALTYLPVGMIHWFFAPLLWKVGSARQAMAIPDQVLWYALIPAIVVGMAWLLRHRFRAVLPLFLTVCGISILYSLVEGNMGIIFRHRAQIIVPLCAVAGVAHALRARAARKEARRSAGAVPLDAPAGGALRPAPGL